MRVKHLAVVVVAAASAAASWRVWSGDDDPRLLWALLALGVAAVVLGAALSREGR